MLPQTSITSNARTITVSAIISGWGGGTQFIHYCLRITAQNGENRENSLQLNYSYVKTVPAKVKTL